MMDSSKQLQQHSQATAAKPAGTRQPLRACQLMEEPAVTCLETDSCRVVADKMRERNIGAVVVVTGEGKVKAVVTDRDICIAAADTGKPLDGLRVDAAHSATPLTCMADDSIETAQNIMQVSSVRRIVVIDTDDRPLGLLSLDDLAVEALRELERDDLHPSIPLAMFVRTMGEVARAVVRSHIPIPSGSEALPRPIR
jgi:CBS domain-containing protein